MEVVERYNYWEGAGVECHINLVKGIPHRHLVVAWRHKNTVVVYHRMVLRKRWMEWLVGLKVRQCELDHSRVMPERWGQPAKTRRVEYLGFPGWRPLHHNLYKTLRLLEASYHTNYTA